MSELGRRGWSESYEGMMVQGGWSYVEAQESKRESESSTGVETVSRDDQSSSN